LNVSRTVGLEASRVYWPGAPRRFRMDPNGNRAVGWAKAEGRAHAGRVATNAWARCALPTLRNCGLSRFGPLRKRRVGRRAQWGARQDVEQASSGQGRPVDAPPEHGAPPGDRSQSERRGRRGVLSFGSFSLDKQRKGTRRRRAPEPVSARPKVGRPSTSHRKRSAQLIRTPPSAWARCALPTLRAGRRFADTSSGEQRP